VKNYSKKQIIIDRENFNPVIAYNLSKKVYYKNFAQNPKYKIAQELKEDLIQESVTRLFELSGKKSTTTKYSSHYGMFFVAHNAMLSYITSHLAQDRYKRIWKNAADVIRCYPDLTFSSNFTTC
jgi:hypothetical protein